MNGEVRFRPIDLEQHADLAVAMRVDSYVVSFGNADLFKGGEYYLEFLRERIAWDNRSVVHVWREDETGAESIIGQIELRPDRNDETIGYVNLYYLRPEFRGRGLGAALDEYATAFFRERGFTRMRLTVAPENARAVRFYEKRGWRGAGRRPDMPFVMLMEKLVDRR